MIKKFLLTLLILLTLFTFVACEDLIKLKDTFMNTSTTTDTSNETEKETVTNKEETDDVDKVTDADELSKDNSDNLPANSTKENCRLYFYDTKQSKMFYIDSDVVVVDKAKINALTKAHQENKDNSNFLCLTNKVAVTSAKLDGDILRIYFAEDFTKLMSLEESDATSLIQSLVNTYGYNYKIDKVSLYFNKELYTTASSDSASDYIKVDTTSIEAFKSQG